MDDRRRKKFVLENMGRSCYVLLLCHSSLLPIGISRYSPLSATFTSSYFHLGAYISRWDTDVVWAVVTATPMTRKHTAKTGTNTLAGAPRVPSSRAARFRLSSYIWEYARTDSREKSLADGCNNNKWERERERKEGEALNGRARWRDTAREGVGGETGAALSRPQRPLSARTAHHAPAPMKGYHVSRSMSQHSSGGGGGGPCHCPPEDCDGPGREYYQGHSDGQYYPPGGHAEALALERHHSHSHSHSHSGGGTFPRSQHPPLQSFDSCEECLTSGHGGKMHRIPPNMGDQFEKQVPFHPDGFHTLQYQRTASGGAEQRSESPSRIRHLVNSVQRLFAKSHSLEAPSKREYNGTRGGGDYRGERGGGHRSGGEDGGGHYSGHQSRSTRRSKSRERSKSGDSRHESGRRHRSRTAGWWSSDDNLDSDSSYLVSGGRRGYPSGHESLDAAIQELTMKKPKDHGGGPAPGECVACTTMALAGTEGGGHQGHHGHSMKRSTWSAMTVSQAREVYPSTRGGAYNKALVPLESKLKERTFHYLQTQLRSADRRDRHEKNFPPTAAFLISPGVPCSFAKEWREGDIELFMSTPLGRDIMTNSSTGARVPSDDWGGSYGGGGPGETGGEIPCRRMRSGSYIKAMGDDDSVDSDTSPKASPKSTLIAQRDAFRRSISMDQRYSCKQCTDSYPTSRTTPKTHTRSRSYTRSLTSSQLGDTLNRQFEAVCETMFGEVESQAVEALDLPGVFRSRSHSYVRAIQAGCSQDDDCLSVFSMSGPQGSIKGGAGECERVARFSQRVSVGEVCGCRLCGGSLVGDTVGEGIL
ncbi:unnamed protein product [Pleuronectes platessa]|uniref:Discs, large (Drosophila) homolog-associated protein 3 n=1 Tax=Pleuronectes platessa TaxID=8262 RepID=A0A9N7W2W1_PLEPL|nr:unnamed protein product [Pleuronectes platessa]